LATALTSIVEAIESAAPAPREQVRWPQYRALLIGIVALGAIDSAWLALSDLHIAFWPAVLRAGIPAVLLAGAAFYGLSGRSDRICATLLSVGTLLLFTLFGVVLSYLPVRTGMPFVDDSLAAADRALGLDWPAYQQFFAGHRWVTYVTAVLYDSSVIQILLVALFLGFSGRFADLAEFTAVLICAGFVAVTVGALLPALGAYHHFGMPDNGVAFFVPTIIADHSGALHVLDLSAAQGLVVFPSFHTAISVAVMVGCWRVRYLRSVALVINAVLIAGVPVWGSHYFVDLIGGAFIVGAAVAGWRGFFGAPDQG